mgnify:CR=1 FL=1
MTSRLPVRGVVLSIACLFLGAGALPAIDPGYPTTGPDVTVSVIWDLASYGEADGYLGYTVGTTSCNIGTVPVNWCDDAGGCDGVLSDEQHPVIAQGIYRLKAGRLQQVGMSWLKHGFVSTNSDEAPCKQGTLCQGPPLGGNQLGVGCNDTYWATLNGNRPLGKRSEVNPTTGAFPFPYGFVGSSGPYQQRVKVAVTEIDPDQNPGALYWAEGQYVSDNDALNGNGLNNATHQSISVDPGTLDIALQGSVIRERSAIHAWRAADATVEMYNVNVPGTPPQRFELARRVSVVDGDTWRYEYAIRNMNSDRAANSFAVDFPNGTPITNTGFSDIEHHSGEPYATTDWNVTVSALNGTVTWGTDSFATDPNANALRWATMFNFWFDADAPPQSAVHALGLFKPGSPINMTFTIPLFADGFEAHNLTAWASVTP